MEILTAEPDNDEIRSAYCDWLEQTNDVRAPYVRLMRKRLQLLAELEKTEGVIWSEQLRIDPAWMDLTFPMRVRSPGVGRCHLKRLPDAAPFVEVGSRVTHYTVVCMIEVMGFFNEVFAGSEGVVAEVAVADGVQVEYDQVLFRLNRMSLDYW